MGNLQSVTDLTRLAQDVQYTTALRGMSEQQKQTYFNSQKQELIDDVLKDREATFQKTYTDAVRNNAIQHSLFFYQQRNRDLETLGSVIRNKNEAEIGTTKYNNQLATRQYEVNEWSYNNKMDTLFVFQLLFVTLALAAALMYVAKLGFVSQTVVGIVVGILLVIDILVLYNRYTYTNRTRNKRYWNKRNYPRRALPQGDDSGSTCPPNEEGFLDSQPGPAPPPSTY
jgi:hypothetical protein